MIKLEAKRFELNFLLKLSDLKSNLTLTLSYLNPALNNPGQNNRIREFNMAAITARSAKKSVSYHDL